MHPHFQSALLLVNGLPKCIATDHNSIELKRVVIQLVINQAWLANFGDDVTSQYVKSVYCNFKCPQFEQSLNEFSLSMNESSYEYLNTRLLIRDE